MGIKAEVLDSPLASLEDALRALSVGENTRPARAGDGGRFVDWDARARYCASVQSGHRFYGRSGRRVCLTCGCPG